MRDKCRSRCSGRSSTDFACLAPQVPSLRLVFWEGPTAGLADDHSEVAFAWRLVPLDAWTCCRGH